MLAVYNNRIKHSYLLLVARLQFILLPLIVLAVYNSRIQRSYLLLVVRYNF